jgi:hypothetical protein
MADVTRRLLQIDDAPRRNRDAEENNVSALFWFGSSFIADGR